MSDRTATPTILPRLPSCKATTGGRRGHRRPYTTLIDATVDEGAVVERSRVQESHIGVRTDIGPWTYLRRATSSAGMQGRRVRRE